MRRIKKYTTLQKLNNVIDGAIRACMNDHPGSIDPNFVSSLRKRIATQLQAHLGIKEDLGNGGHGNRIY